jgi:GYF domain 2
MSNNDVPQEGVATPERPEWFYELNGSRVGPATRTKISELLAQGTLTNTTLVWKSAFGPEWRQIDATDLLQIDTTTPPPLPQSHINEVYARGLVLIPLIGAGFEGFLRNVFSHVPDIAIFGFYFIANTILSVTDSKQISESGRNPNNLRLGFWFWLIPVYLYQRAKILGQKQIYVFCWIVALVAGAFLSEPDLFSGNTYWGFGVPSCGSGFTKNNVKNIFADIEQVRLRGLQALDISHQRETAREQNKNLCTATVTATDGREYQIVYTIEVKSNQIFFLVNLR